MISLFQSEITNEWLYDRIKDKMQHTATKTPPSLLFALILVGILSEFLRDQNFLCAIFSPSFDEKQLP